MKKLDGVEIPGARPTDISPASMTRAVGWTAPATSASASPAFTAIAAWNSGFASSRFATRSLVLGRPST